jgi:hypothetical protein
LLSDGSGLVVNRPQAFSRTQPAVRTVDLLLPATGQVVGSVRNRAGDPVAAEVELLNRRVDTDSAGRFQFHHVLPGQVRVYAESQSSRTPGLSEEGVVESGTELELDVELSATGRVTGALLDEEGQPLARPIYLLALRAPTRSGSWLSSLTTDAGGRFSVVAPVGPYRVVFNGEYDGPACQWTAPAAAEGWLEDGAADAVQLQRGSHRMAGILGGPLGAYGEEASCSGSTLASPRLETLAGGSVSYDSVVSPESDGRAMRTLREVVNGLEVRKQEYVPESGAFARTLTILHNPTGEPITIDASSFLRLPVSSAACTGLPAWTIEETADGSPGLEESDRYAVFRFNGGQQDSMAVVVGPALPPTNASFQPGQLPSESGACGDAIEGRVQLDHTLSVPALGTRAFLTFTVARVGGDTTLRDQVLALDDLTAPDALVGLTEADRDAVVNFILPGQTRLTGRVVDGDGAPASEVRVRLVGDGLLLEEIVSDSEGAFTFVDVAPGEYVLVATDAENWPGRAVASVVEGEINEILVRLAGDDEVAAVVVHAAGPPEPGAEGLEVRLTLEEYPGWSASATFDAQGTAEFRDVPSGRVRVSVESAGEAVTAEAQHSPPTPTQIDMELGRASGGAD